MTKTALAIILLFVGLLLFHYAGQMVATPEIWYRNHSEQILSEPVKAGDKAVFVSANKRRSQYSINHIGPDGKFSEPLKLLVTHQQMIPVGDRIIQSDKNGGVVRSIAIPSNEVNWEAGTSEPLRIPPAVFDNRLVLVPTTKEILFCLDIENGQPIWELLFTGTIINIFTDNAIAVIHGDTAVKNPLWKLSGVDAEEGYLLWTFDGSIEPEEPLAFNGMFFFCDSNGRPTGLDQETGQVLFRYPTEGLRIAGLVDDKLLLLGAGGSRLECYCLSTGNAWSSTLSSSFIGAAMIGRILVIADKKGLRAVDAVSADVKWERNLGEVFNIYRHRHGVAVTFKETFVARSTYMSYFDAATGNQVWTTIDKGIFYSPIEFDTGDIVMNRTGSVRMMPLPPKHLKPSPVFQDPGGMRTGRGLLGEFDLKEADDEDANESQNKSAEASENKVGENIPEVPATVDDPDR